MKRSSIAVRLVVASLFWISGALLVGNFVLSALFRGYVEDAFDDRLEDFQESLIGSADLDADGRVVLKRAPAEPRFDRPYSGWYWQIADQKGPLLRSRSLWDEVLPTHRVAGPGAMESSVANGPGGQSIRVMERYVALPGSAAIFQFAVAADTSEIARELHLFDQTLAWSLVSLGIGLVAAIFIQVHYGLKPMRHLRAQLSSIRSGRSTRLSGSFPIEVSPLIEDLNALLEHNSAMIDRARTHVGDLAHAVKTPLSVLAAEADSETGPSPEVMKQEIAKIRRQVDHHLARAQAAASARSLGVRTSVLPVVEAVKRALERILPEKKVDIAISCPDATAFRGQREDLEEIIGNLVENGCKWARSEVRIGVSNSSGRVVLTVDDDGPGLDPAQRAAALERGTRLDETAPGSGLGLAIVRDIVAAYDGKFHLEESPIGGLRATVALPSADDGR
jgi:signal transduction histidine kinase